MRKFITIITVTLLTVVAVSGCKRTDPYNEGLKKEYAEFISEHPNGIFYESHVILNENIEDVKSFRKLSAIGSENVFQDSVFCYIFRHDFITGEVDKEVIQDFWLGSECINPNDLNLTLRDALKTYWNSDAERTTGNKVTLRAPVGPKLLPPYYIIGQQNSPCFVTVNALNGEVGYIQ